MMICVRKASLIFLTLVLILCAWTSCAKQGEESQNGAWGKPIFQPEVYEKYDNLVSIEPFHNGLAAFVIHVNDNTMHMSMSSGYWEGTYYYGYIDTNGKVVIAPNYECSSDFSEIQPFDYGYVKVADSDKCEYLIDRSGNIRFRVGENQVSNIGKVAYGYFWIETEEEKVSGNEYTVTYYRCRANSDELTEFHVFENMQAIVDSSNISGLQSTLNEQHEYIVVRNANQSYFGNDDISHYVINGIPESVNWTVDVGEIADFGGAYCWYDTPKSGSNEQGAVAAVVLKNDQGVYFYATVDQSGTVLMQPQKNIVFEASGTADLARYQFCRGLCPAKDAESGKWGYIDPHGNWRIKPQYDDAKPFSEDGYATVNQTSVIDTDGRNVLSP